MDPAVPPIVTSAWPPHERVTIRRVPRVRVSVVRAGRERVTSGEMRASTCHSFTSPPTPRPTDAGPGRDAAGHASRRPRRCSSAPRSRARASAPAALKHPGPPARDQSHRPTTPEPRAQHPAPPVQDQSRPARDPAPPARAPARPARGIGATWQHRPSSRASAGRGGRLSLCRPPAGRDDPDVRPVAPARPPTSARSSRSRARGAIRARDRRRAASPSGGCTCTRGRRRSGR